MSRKRSDTNEQRMTKVERNPKPETRTCTSSGARGNCSDCGFTLVELLVAVTLMTFIVLGLLAMLTTTQRAFRNSLNQTDVQEAGRIATEMISRELEQMTPSLVGPAKNFMVELETNFGIAMLEGLPGTQGAAPGSQGLRTNVVQ